MDNLNINQYQYSSGSAVECLNDDPLKNDEILKNMFGFMTLNDILVCRQVCRKWTNLIINQVICRQEIVFVTEDLRRKSSLTCRYLTILQEFLDCFAVKPEAMIFKNFKFQGLSLNDPLIEEFFKLFGSKIKSLNLDFQDCEKDMVILFDKIFRQFQPECTKIEQLFIKNLPETVQYATAEEFFKNGNLITNIKKLGFGTSRSDKEPSSLANKIFPKVMLMSCPNLEALNIVDFDISLDILPVLLSLRCFQTINELSLKTIQSESFPVINEFRLKSFKVLSIILRQTEDAVKFKLMLQCQSETLKSLMIGSFELHPIEEKTFIHFPIMQKLKSLRLSGVGQDNWKFGFINYTFQFPQLEQLFLDRPATKALMFLEKDAQPHEEIHTLKLPGKFNPISELKHFAKVFPKVKRLEISLCLRNQDKLNELWDLWKDLESLYLNLSFKDSAPISNYCMDKFFTGFSEDECKHLATSMDIGRDFETISASKSKDTYSIHDLSKLKHFRLTISQSQMNNTNNEFKILGNASIWAFSKLTTLEYIKIEAIPNITAEQASVIQEAFPHLQRQVREYGAYRCKFLQFEWAYSGLAEQRKRKLSEAFNGNFSD